MVERVLVTGGGGFIGSHLAVQQLELGREVSVIDTSLARLASLGDVKGLRRFEGDIRDSALLERALPGTDVVFHLASAHLEVTQDADYFQSINVAATRDLARIAGSAGVRRFVHCSSVGVYGPLLRVPADEDTPCRPDIAYEVSKLQGEREVLAVAADNGLSTVVLRPAWVYGPGCPRTEKLFRALRKRRFVMVGKGRNLRHPVYISDMLQAFELAASREGIEGQVFIIASAEYVTLEKLVAAILEVEHSGYRPLRVPLPVMWPVCFAMESLAKLLGREPPFSRRSLKFFTEDSAFSIARAVDKLGYSPGVDLPAGLEMTRTALFGPVRGQ
ncbi:MAG TPA: NAD-dependent epimerase/dehydratase family protein [Gammaproteobacteria bacterium]|nr:NAD-dependent epimerase/dehydratase family protein [Gammaproteobacteria bacterium]